MRKSHVKEYVYQTLVSTMVIFCLEKIIVLLAPVLPDICSDIFTDMDVFHLSKNLLLFLQKVPVIP